MIELYKPCIGKKNQTYYLNQFQQLKKSNNRISWNWSAFIASNFWALYRKMYTWFVVITLIGYVVSYAVIDASLIVKILAFFIQNGLFALYANYLYLGDVHSKICSATQKSTNDQALLKELTRKGGVNNWVLYGFVGIFFMLTFLYVI